MLIKLDLKSNNQKSLRILMSVFNEYCKMYDPQSLFTGHNKKLKRVVISVLKSPHVNKTAQEQFEYKIFKGKLFFKSKNFLRILLLLKKFSNNLFSDVNIKVCFITKPKESLHLKNYHLTKINSSYLKIADINGEKLLNSSCFNSSVGRAKD